MQAILNIMAAIAVLVFLYFFVLPFLKEKVLMWRVKRLINKVAREVENEKTRDELLDLAKGIKEYTKNMKL